MKIFILTLFIFNSTQVLAQDLNTDDIHLTLDEMVRNNIISQAEANRAKLKLKNDHKSFLGSTTRMPASVHTQLIDSTESTDLSKVQIKDIEKEIDHIFRRAMDR